MRLVEDLRGVGEVGDRRAEPLLRQELHHLDEAGVELADQVGVADPHVLEEQLGGVGLGLADLVELAAAEKPSATVSTPNSVMPLAFFSGLVRAATTTRSAEQPLVMKVLEPLRIQSSPSRTAVVLSAARSEPPEGSVMPIAVSSSPEQKPRQPALLLLLGGQVHEVRRHDVGVDAEQEGSAMLTLASSSVSTALKR